MTRGFTEVTRRLKAVFSGGNAGGHSGNVGGDSGNVGDTEDTRGGPYPIESKPSPQHAVLPRTPPSSVNPREPPVNPRVKLFRTPTPLHPSARLTPHRNSNRAPRTRPRQ
jgi:hypothetical protein